MAIITRFIQHLYSTFPNLLTAHAERSVNKRFDHAKYGIKPRHHIFQQHPMVNDELPNRIQCGTMVIKPAIKDVIPPKTILFEDGSLAENIDIVVMCTGYSFGFPFLENGKLLPVVENRIKLYKMMFVPELAHPETLPIIGCFQSAGALMPISEMQSRVACELLKDNATIRLPTRSAMYQGINEHGKIIGRFVQSRRHTIQVDFIPYMNELAEMIRAKPSLLYFSLKDPRLFVSLYFGPCLPYQYRLQGPHPWKGARDAQLQVWDRVWYPTRSSIGASADGRCSCPKESKCAVRASRIKFRVVAAVICLGMLMSFTFCCGVTRDVFLKN